jgi:hypothetical protein
VKFVWFVGKTALKHLVVNLLYEKADT